MADVDVEASVAIHVGERDAGGPAIALDDSSGLRDVAKPKSAQVPVEARTALIGGEDQVRQSITGDVAQRDTATVIEVAIGEDVEVARVGEVILEMDAGVARGEKREEPPIRCRGRGLGGIALWSGASSDDRQKKEGRSMLRPSVKRLRQLVPVVLGEQGVGVNLPLRNGHQDAAGLLTLWPRLPLPRLRVRAKPDEVLSALRLTGELKQPLAQNDGQRDRARAFASDTLSAVTLPVILRERLFEFTGEAKRRQDLIRFGAYTQPWEWKTGPEGQEPRRVLMPIPQGQIDANPLLTQNNGY